MSKKTNQFNARLTSGLAGASLGGTAGASLGGSIVSGVCAVGGSVVGPVGTFFGAAVGSGAGAAVGGAVGAVTSFWAASLTEDAQTQTGPPQPIDPMGCGGPVYASICSPCRTARAVRSRWASLPQRSGGPSTCTASPRYISFLTISSRS